VDSYSDRAISGASLIRSGIQSLLADAQAGRFDMVLSEALNRISRDQEDVAAVFKRLRRSAKSSTASSSRPARSAVTFGSPCTAISTPSSNGSRAPPNQATRPSIRPRHPDCRSR